MAKFTYQVWAGDQLVYSGPSKAEALINYKQIPKGVKPSERREMLECTSIKSDE